MNLTEAAIRFNRVTFAAVFFIVIGGIAAYFLLSRSEDPGFRIRMAQVVTVFPGASPERVEQLVTDKLEKAIQEMPELDNIQSQSKTGVSIIVVNLKETYKDLRPIWDKLRRKINRVHAELPDNVNPSLVNDEYGDVFGVVLGITGTEGFNYAQLKTVADEVRNELLLFDSIAKVDIYGAQEERLFVEYSNARLAEYGLSPAQFVNILSSRNIIIPGGEINAGREQVILEPSGNFESLEDVRRSLIQLPGSGQVVALEDIANVKRGYIDPPRAKVHVTDNEKSLTLAISMRQGGNILQLGTEIKTFIEKLKLNYPIGIEFETIVFQPEIVNFKIKEFTGNLIQAIGIVTLIMLIFLGIRTGLVVSALIPAAILMSLSMMAIFNIGLDQVSLAALIIALGMLVDNAIVMSENTLVQMETGKSRSTLEAAVASAKELKIPLLTSSLTTSAAFLPIYLAESTTGEYTAPLFKVVSITLLCSWVLSLTLIPLLCVKFLRVRRTVTDRVNMYRDRKFYRGYRQILLYMLRFRWLSIIGICLVFYGAILGFQQVPRIFFPPSDKPLIKVDYEMPIGTSIAHTEEVISQLEDYLVDALKVNEQRPRGLTHWAIFIGNTGPRFVLQHRPQPGTPNAGLMILNTSDEDIIPEMIKQLEAYTSTTFPDLRMTARKIRTGPPIKNPIEIRLSGRDLGQLFELVEQVKVKLNGIPGAIDIDDDWGLRTKKLAISVDASRAQRAGLTNKDIAISLQAALSGIELTQYREGNELIPITLRSTEADRHDLGKLEALNVYSQRTGLSIPLLQVADVDVAWQPARIIRRNRLKTVTISAQLAKGFTAKSVNDQVQPWLADQAADWPLGYHWEFGGEAESSGKANKSIKAKLPYGLFIILMVLIAQFNSIRRAGIVLLTIPLSIIGVSFGLNVFNSYIGFMTFLGIISLAGIVINNAIVLLERIKIEIEENDLEPRRALLEASQRRLRPILLTTATTICGLIPLWLGGGAMWQPMAIAIIFGLLGATVLTLGIIPVLYSLFFRVNYRDFSY